MGCGGQTLAPHPSPQGCNHHRSFPYVPFERTRGMKFREEARKVGVVTKPSSHDVANLKKKVLVKQG